MPEEIEGVNVRYKRHSGPITLDDCPLREEHDPIQGGYVLRGEQQSSYSRGTLCARMKNDGGDDAFITAAHLFDEDSLEDCTQEPDNEDVSAYQKVDIPSGNDSRELGSVELFAPTYDFAAVDDSGPVDDLSFEVETTTIGVVTVQGHAVNYDVLEENDTWIRKVGISTNHEWGQIEDYNISESITGCITYVGRGLRLSHDAAGGDSAGPYIVEDDGDYYLVGMHSASVDDEEEPDCEDGPDNVGSPSYALQSDFIDDQGYYFNP